MTWLKMILHYTSTLKHHQRVPRDDVACPRTASDKLTATACNAVFAPSPRDLDRVRPPPYLGAIGRCSDEKVPAPNSLPETHKSETCKPKGVEVYNQATAGENIHSCPQIRLSHTNHLYRLLCKSGAGNSGQLRMRQWSVQSNLSYPSCPFLDRDRLCPLVIWVWTSSSWIPSAPSLPGIDFPPTIPMAEGAAEAVAWDREVEEVVEPLVRPAPLHRTRTRSIPNHPPTTLPVHTPIPPLLLRRAPA